MLLSSGNHVIFSTPSHNYNDLFMFDDDSSHDAAVYAAYSNVKRPDITNLIDKDTVTLYPDGRKDAEPQFRLKVRFSKNGYECEDGYATYPDSGSMLNLMDWGWYGEHRYHFGEPLDSDLNIRVADGAVREPKGRLKVNVLIDHPNGILKSPTWFYLVDSNGSFDTLLGRPWLAQTGAKEDHANKTLIFRTEQGDVNIKSEGNGNTYAMPPVAASVLHITEVEHDYAVPPECGIGDDSTVPSGAGRLQEILEQIEIGKDLTEDQRQMVVDLVSRYHNAFARSLSEVEESPLGQHTFDVDPNIKLPQRARTMRMHKVAERAMQQQCDRLLAAGILEYCPPEQVKCISDTIMIKKKETYNTEELAAKFQQALDTAKTVSDVPEEQGDDPIPAGQLVTTSGTDDQSNWRMVHNYRALNRAIKIGAYLPGSIFNKVSRHAGKRYLSVLDQLGAYFACSLAPEVRGYTAFQLPNGPFVRYTRMPQGLQGSPVTHQVNTATAFSDLLNNFLDVWMDDFFCSSDDFNTMLAQLEAILKRAVEFKVRFSPKKTKLFVSNAVVGGQLLTPDGMKPDPAKVEAITSWPIPKTAHELMAFLGTTGYFRNRIKNYAVISGSLHDLTRNIHYDREGRKGLYKKALEETKITDRWTNEHTEAFQHLKSIMTSFPVIQAPDYNYPFHIASDASAQGFGAHLYQIKSTDGLVCTIEFASRRTSQSEANRHSSHLELRAVKWAVDKFKPTVGWSPIHLHTDCEAVANMLNSDRTNWLTEEWKLAIFQNNIWKVSHTKASDNKVADALSRMPTQPSGPDITPELDYQGVENDLFWTALDNTEQLRHRFSNEDLLPVILYLCKIQLPDDDKDWVVRRADQYYVSGGKLFRKGRGLKDLEVLTRSEGKRLARLTHDTNGHLSLELTLKDIQRSKTWSYIRKDVEEVCATCVECHKHGPKARDVLTHSVQRFTPFESVALDLLKLPESHNDCEDVLVAIDVHSKFIWAWPILVQPTMKTTIACLNDLAQKYRLPYEIISDNETKLMGDLVQKHFPEVIFTQCAPSAHVGTVENTNRQILNRLKRMVNVDITDINSAAAKNARKSWEQWLPAAVASLNNRPMDVLGGLSPRDVLFGLRDDRSIPADFEQRHRARQNMEDEIAAELQHRRTKKIKPSKPVSFSVDQLVEIYNTSDMGTRVSTRKLAIQWYGPFRIVSLGRKSATIVDANGKRPRVVKFEFMRPWQGATKMRMDGNDDMVSDDDEDDDMHENADR